MSYLTRDGEIIICPMTCWACKFNHHDEAWHSWADADDIEHAKYTGQPDPSTQRCGCYCQKESKEAPKP